MRLRYKHWAKEKIEQYPQYVVSSPEQYKGKWGTAFEKDQPLHIELSGETDLATVRLATRAGSP